MITIKIEKFLNIINCLKVKIWRSKKVEKIFSEYYHDHNQFIFKKGESELIKSKKNMYELKKINTNLYFAKPTGRSSAYIDLYNNNLYLASASGIFFKIDYKNFDDFEIKPKKIETNIKDFIKNENFFLRSYYGIKDILINNNYILVSYINEVKKDCFNTGILKAKINDDYLDFEKFFNHSECKSSKNSKYNTFSVGQAGGRIIKYYNNYLLTHGSYSEFDEVQDQNSIFGKIIMIDKKGKFLKVFSKGHRNPQGLVFNNNIIIETEHGPEGGDEINLISENKNYGWPIASYGKHYKGQKHVNKFYPLPYPHENFEEPLKFFEKSIAISQIIGVPKEFNDENDDTIFIASMKINNNYGNKINLFNFVHKNKKLILNDIIPIGERIRDLIYDKNNNQIIMFLDTSASLAILKKLN